ncbi:MAG: anti-sigma factor [Ignavibacteria bacterium]|nr:anti-sigma factor [Ignavibacteria bacterium]
MKAEERHSYLELCIPYVFGRLNPGNRKQFEAHLATGCVPCTKELAELHEAMALLPVLLKQEVPPQRVRERVLADTSARKTERPPVAKMAVEAPGKEEAPVSRRPRPWLSYTLVFLSVVIILVLALFVNDLLSTIGGQERRAVELQGELQKRDEVLSVLRSDRLELILLNGLGPSPETRGKLLWDPSKKRAILQTSDLPESPANNEYQLWIIKSGRASSAGTFAVAGEKERESFFKVIDLTAGERQEIDGFSVTLEPKGGSAQPTGVVYLRGTVR